MSVNDAIRVYISFAKQVFAAKATRWWWRCTDGGSFGNILLFRFRTSTVLAVKKHAPVGEPTLLRTYSSPDADTAPCSIWQAARASATTAASSFFKSINIIRAGGIEAELVDAGLGFNNSTEQALNETIRIWGRSHPIGCLLSIGTGHPKITATLHGHEWCFWSAVGPRWCRVRCKREGLRLQDFTAPGGDR